MIAFGSAMTDPEAYRRYAGPGIAGAAEPDSAVYAFAAVGSICRGYNLLLDAAAARRDLEALVLVQQEVEIADPDLCRKAREILADPDVAVAGCAGATGVRSIAWWEGAISSAPIVHRYQEHGGGELRAFSWKPHDPAPADVESVDGFLLVLSPWAVRNVRFDEELTLGHGYDLDYCLQARAAGRKVMTGDFRVVWHHPSLELLSEPDVWVEGHIRAAQKWDGRMPGVSRDEQAWKERARRAEAEREAARTVAYSNGHQVDAQLLPLERELEAITRSLAWKLTAPLRRANRWRSTAFGRRRAR